MSSRKLRVAAGLALIGLLGGCSASQSESTSEPTARIRIDTSDLSAGAVIGPELFGVNSTWLDSGHRILDYGELLHDRSFRNQGTPVRRWMEFPNEATAGTLERIDRGGSTLPARFYPGFLRMSQKLPGYTCISQLLTSATEAKTRYELHFSARGKGGTPGMSAFFADGGFMPIEPLDNLAIVEPDDWADYRFELRPDKLQSPGLVRICLVTAGVVDIDEVRLRRLGEPQIRPQAHASIERLGVGAMRWPAGSDADTFDWRESVGPIDQRGESPTVFGDYQTASFGLHEFLDYCERTGIVPLLTINVQDTPESAADLVEYVLGPRSSPMGKLREANGRRDPWRVEHFELGNEPVETYRGDFSADDTSKGYLAKAVAISRAMKRRAEAFDVNVSLKGILETGFAKADWISVVPLLARWNDVVTDSRSGLLRHVDEVKGHFYSAMIHRDSEKAQYNEIMAGGTTLAATVRDLNRRHGPLPPFWLTEYSLFVQRKDVPGNQGIVVERLKDFQAGLSVADLLLTAINEGYAGAFVNNLADEANWGILGNARDFRLRPSGLAFSMIARLRGGNRLSLVIEGGEEIVVQGGDGNNPAGMTFPALASAAAYHDGEVRLIVLNRSYGTAERVAIEVPGLRAGKVTVDRLGPESLQATNDTRADTVRIKSGSDTVTERHVLNLPPKSMAYVSYPVE